MTKARQDLNIIEFDPNTTRYGKRIPKEAWDKIRAQVLPYLALSVANIRRELKSQQIFVTEHQLQRKVKKWRSDEKRSSESPRAIGLSRDPATLKHVSGREKKRKDMTQTPRVRGTPRLTSNIDSDL
ncbi:uncharacterized protein PV07_12550 [Cladophialophora immunda]|uniref:Clr5 domain-containing protein n=1 Tax=Cladophialophora immunda TaxID=569365 RepID=A0A0D2BSQ6_9EURO|nr:uncharacterized protein PV07_12550 [Cladophialophora immunda]KIW22058.1 hypothetical protein PV07_12550 [Cladophialophora immunda]